MDCFDVVEPSAASFTEISGSIDAEFTVIWKAPSSTVVYWRRAVVEIDEAVAKDTTLAKFITFVSILLLIKSLLNS
jgi:hypothetical protein